MAVALKPVEDVNADKPKPDTKDVVRETYTPELVIALCGPIGSPLHEVCQAITTQLESFQYDTKRIRLSDFIRKHANKVGQRVAGNNEAQRLQSLIKSGDALRKRFDPSILAQLAIRQIRIDRQAEKASQEQQGSVANPSFRARRVCHIIDSIKNQEELDLLRLIYGDMLFMIGVFSPMALREKNLSAKGMTTQQIYSLVEEDSGAEIDEGQTVRKTFPLCDMFLRIEKGTDAHLMERVERFVHLMLGARVITPTRNETAMYAAAMASANSACLSRQVGASVTDLAGEVLSVGWNDVPSPKGGLYADISEENDYRCWNLGGVCANDREKDTLAEEILAALGELVSPEKHAEAKQVIRKSGRLNSLIEFSRAIHAEMHAIINAGQTSGRKMRGGKLFVTTYPCHSCARHIIAAGITEVYFIEPYRKSLALKLHSDAITEDENDTTKVRLLAYDGVAPTRYLSLFRVPPDSRKKDGKMTVVTKAEVRPRSHKSMEALAALEGLIANSSEIAALVDAGDEP